MVVKILAFGVVKEIFDASSIELDINSGIDVAGLKQVLQQRFPRMKQLASFMIAVNNEYANETNVITGDDEIALIPPVSGG